LKSFRDYITLTKPRLNSLAILTTLAGFYMASRGPMDGQLLLLTLLGTTGVAAGCGALNQWLEADTDLHMVRTKKRPLPSGRLTRSQAFWFGLVLSILGVVLLDWKVNDLTALLGLSALVSYIIFYTPMKRISSLCTVVGAFPGAIPPVMGWTAVRGQVGHEGWVLFAILFLWQMPHFLAIGWMYRDDYARAGLPMLAVVDPKGHGTGLMAVAYSFALWPVSLMPSFLHMTGHLYFWCALVLSFIFLWTSFRLAWSKTERQAKGLFWASITYLPILFIVMAFDKA